MNDHAHAEDESDAAGDVGAGDVGGDAGAAAAEPPGGGGGGGGGGGEGGAKNGGGGGGGGGGSGSGGSGGGSEVDVNSLTISKAKIGTSILGVRVGRIQFGVKLAQIKAMRPANVQTFGSQCLVSKRPKTEFYLCRR